MTLINEEKTRRQTINPGEDRMSYEPEKEGLLVERAEMKENLQTSLYSKYPKLFAQRHLTSAETRMVDGLVISDFWYDLIDRMCIELQALSDRTGLQIEFVQVKEKLGGLRAYVNHSTEEARRIIEKYEKEASKTCEECGSTDKVSTRGRCYIETLCDKCYADRQDK